MIKPIKENNFIWLTLALIIAMLVGALTDEFPGVYALYLIEYGTVFLLLVSLQSLRNNKSVTRRLLVILGFMMILSIGRHITSSSYLEVSYLLFLLAFYVSAAWLVGRQVLLTGSVDLNKMIGAIALYLLLGQIFSVLYTLLLQYSPNALEGIEVSTWSENLANTSYFSFVTLTTLGYGDISPVTPISRVLVIIEAVTGMFYLATVVASLVGSMMQKD